MQNLETSELVDNWKQQGLSTRASYVLAKAGISDITTYDSIEALIGIKNCGFHTAQEIWDFIENAEVKLKEVNFEDLIPE